MRSGRVVHWVMAVLLVLYLSSHVLLNSKRIQQEVAAQVVRITESTLGVRLESERMELRQPFGLSLEGVVLYDEKGDTLFSATTLLLGFRPLALLQGELSIGTLRLINPYIRVTRDNTETPSNYQFLLELLKGDGEEGSKRDIRVNSVVLRNGRFCFDTFSEPETPCAFNSEHVELYDFTACLSLKHYSGDSLALNLRRLQFKEKSGLELKRAGATVRMNRNSTVVKGAFVETPRSKVTVPVMELPAGSGGFDRSSKTEHSISFRSCITPADFKALMPELAPMVSSVELNAGLRGDSEEICVEDFIFRTKGGEALLTGRTSITGYDRAEKMAVYNLCLKGALAPELYSFLKSRLSGFKIELPSRLNVLGETNFTLEGAGTLASHDFKLIMKSGAGNVNAVLSKSDFRQNINLVCEGLNLKGLTGNGDLKQCDLSLDALRTTDRNGLCEGDYSLRLSNLDFKGYTFSPINATGRYTGDGISTTLQLMDTVAKVSLDASALRLSGGGVRVSAALDVDSLDLYGMKFTSGAEGLVCGFNLNAEMEGSSLDNLVGYISLDSITVANPSESWLLESMDLALSDFSSEGVHSFTLKSELLSCEIEGCFGFTTLADGLCGVLEKRLPSLYAFLEENVGLAPVTASKREACKGDSYALGLTLYPTTLWERVLGLPFAHTTPITANYSYNAGSGRTLLTANAHELFVSGKHVEAGTLRFEENGEELRLLIAGAQGRQGSAMVEFESQFKARSDSLFMTLSLNNRGEGGEYGGELVGKVDFNGFDRTHKWLSSYLTFDATRLKINGQEWFLTPTYASVDSGRVEVYNFHATNREQFIKLNGVIAEDSASVLTLSVGSVELAPVLDMANGNSMRMEGRTTGVLNARSLRGNPLYTGEFDVEGFSLLGEQYGSVTFGGEWNGENSVNLLALVERDGSVNTRVTGFYDFTDKLIDLDINANHTNLHFLNLFLGGVFTEVRGEAVGRMRLYGPLNRLNLEGRSVLERGELAIGALNTTYYVKHDTLCFYPNLMEFKGVHFTDKYDHPGLLDCTVRHDCLKNFSVNLGANVQDAQVFDKPKVQNNAIYAKVFANGNVSLSSSKASGLSIDVTARSSRGTVFGYNLNTETLSDNSFLEIRSGTLSLDSLVQDVADHAVLKESKSPMRISINLNATTDAEIQVGMQSLSSSIRGNGTIQALYDRTGDLSLHGLYSVSHGSCALSLENLFRTNFTLSDESTVLFTGNPNETELNLTAYHMVNSANIKDLDPGAGTNSNLKARCILDITGKVTSPELGFNVDLPVATPEERDLLSSAISTEEQRNMQFIYLLTLGKFYTYDYADRQQTFASQGADAILNSTLTRQLNNLLSRVVNSDVLSLSSNITTAQAFSSGPNDFTNTELEGILEARLLNNRLLVNGNFGYRENTLMNKSSFIGDFEVRWLLLPQYGLSLKAYSKNNDKYFSKTTLTTQGVGWVYEKDFDYFFSKRSLP